MAYISQASGYIFLLLFGVGMVLATYFFTSWRKRSKEGFLVANRKINWFFGGSSIAASWIWAPALFVSVQLAYEKGLAGVFWFTVPNIIALAIFAFLAPQIRKKMPEGFTLPQYIKHKLKDKSVHRIYLIPYFFYQIMAITIQIFVGGTLINLLTGIPLLIIMPLLLIIALAYTSLSGIKASITTDFIQMALIFVIGIIVLPLTWNVAGGFSAISAGLHGLEGIKNIFNGNVAFSLGIVTSIGLIAGAIADQQYWQRSFSIKKKDLAKSFVFGALLFGVVPIALSTLGFLGANSALGITLPIGVDSSMIGVQVVANLLPMWAMFLFVIMLLSGLSSTLDSGLSAISSLWTTDVAKKGFSLKSAKKAMLGFSIVGLIVALSVNYIPGFGLFHLWWIFNTIAACVVVPTILSLYWKRLSAKGVLLGVIVSFVIGLPLFIYGNVIGNSTLTVGASLFIILISTLFCLLFPKKKVSN